VFLKIDEINVPLNFGQILAVVAFLYFREKGVQWAVIECSIGGLSSSTNFLDTDIAVIVSIGLDHQEILGETIEEICRNKSGIIRKNKPVIIGPHVPIAVV